MSPAIAALLFFVSGLGALVAETTWLRWLRLAFGATAPAVSATLVAFLVGHGLGAVLAPRLRARLGGGLRAYGVLELVVAAGLLLVPAGLALGDALVRGVYDSLRETPAQLTALRFAVALAATLVAATAMGATLPILTAALVRDDAQSAGRHGTALYAANLAGAAIGTLLAAIWLPEWLGVRGSYAVAIGCALAAGGGALAFARGAARTRAAVSARAAGATGAEEADETTAAAARSLSRAERRAAERAAAKRAVRGTGDARAEAHTARDRAAQDAGTGPFATLAALSGFVAFALQVLFVQSFAQVLNGSVLAFAAVLVSVLASLAAGAAIIAALEARGLDAARLLLGPALVAATLCVTAFPALLSGSTQGLSYVGVSSRDGSHLLAALGTTIPTAGPALLAAGLVFPATLAWAARARPQQEAAPLVGRLVAWNTLGSIAGALAAPWLLLPVLGLWGAFLALGAVLGLAAVLASPPSPRRITRDLALALGWIVVIQRGSPLAQPTSRLAPGEEAIWTEASASGLVSVIERAGHRTIRTDNHSVLGGTADVVHQQREAHLALLLRPGARRVAHVGSATGISASAALAHPIDSLVLVEIVPGVTRAARDLFAQANARVHDDPRTRVVLDDGRNFLRATRERFDVVIADLFVPWRGGTGSMWAREHFAAVRERLSEGGVFVQWLPLYQLDEAQFRIVAAGFADVFGASAVFRGDFYGGYPIVALVGWRDAAPAPEAIAAAARALGERGVRDRWVIDPAGVFALYVGPLAPWASGLGEVPRNTDDRPRIELLAARGHAGGDIGKLAPLTALAWLRVDEEIRRAGARAGGDPVFPALDGAWRRASAGGAALQGAGALFVEARRDEAARALAQAAELLPPELVKNATADPTAAEVWRDAP